MSAFFDNSQPTALLPWVMMLRLGIEKIVNKRVHLRRYTLRWSKKRRNTTVGLALDEEEKKMMVVVIRGNECVCVCFSVPAQMGYYCAL